MDQPTVDGLNIYFISNITKSLGIKCALSGIGSDEIFYGYPSFQNAKYLYYLKNFNILGISNHLPDKYQKLDFLSLNYPGNIYSASRAIFSISEISQILGYSTKKIIQTLNNKLNSENIINNNLYDTIGNFELKNYMKNQLLRDSDVFGMANSVEIRVPFLSKELTEMVLAINYKNKFSKKYNKRLLVDTLRNKIPNEILFRKKKGFELPYHFWISNNQDILKIPKEHLKVLNKKNSHWSKKWSLNILNTFKNI